MSGSSAFNAAFAKIVNNGTALPAIAAFNLKVLKSKDVVMEFALPVGGYNAKEIIAAIEKPLTGKGKVVKDTLFSNGNTYSCVVTSCADSLPFNKDSIGGKRIVQANVFHDPQDSSIWNVIGEGENARLVKSTDEDQSEILKSAFYSMRASRQMATAALDSAPAIGDFAAYFDPTSLEVKTGFVAASNNDTTKVVDSKTRRVVEMETASVLLSVESPRTTAKYREIASLEKSMELYIEFLRSVYENGEADEYIKALKEAVENSRAD